MRRECVPRGFSLIEALVSVVILAMIGTLSFSTFARAMAARDRATLITDRYHSARQAMGRMAREISMAYLTHNRDCADARTLTTFVAKRQANGARLDFTSFSHVKMRGDAKESDQNELSYFVAPDPKISGMHNLMRREQNRVDERPTEGGRIQILANNVEELSFTFYDAKADQWQDEWDTAGRDTKDRLPKFVRIKLKARDHLQHIIAFETKTRVFLREAIYIPGVGRGRCIE